MIAGNEFVLELKNKLDMTVTNQYHSYREILLTVTKADLNQAFKERSNLTKIS